MGRKRLHSLTPEPGNYLFPERRKHTHQLLGGAQEQTCWQRRSPWGLLLTCYRAQGLWGHSEQCSQPWASECCRHGHKLPGPGAATRRPKPSNSVISAQRASKRQQGHPRIHPPHFLCSLCREQIPDKAQAGTATPGEPGWRRRVSHTRSPCLALCLLGHLCKDQERGKMRWQQKEPSRRSG